MSRKKTPKQILLSHIRNDHRRIPAKSWTMKQLSEWHSHTHHWYVWPHYHDWDNLGSNDRPKGWQTGEDVVWKT